MKTIKKHSEKHKKASERIRDFIIGMSDGLTVPFALTAGLSGVNLANNIIVTAGLAEIAAGSVAMALGAYLATKTEIEHYNAELKREIYEIEQFPEKEEDEVNDVLKSFGVNANAAKVITKEIICDKKGWLDFMMRFELGLEKPNNMSLILSPVIIGVAYITGGIIPLIPYMMHSDVKTALNYSIFATAIALLVFGFVKGLMTGAKPLQSSISTLAVGGLAAFVAYTIAKLI